MSPFGRASAVNLGLAALRIGNIWLAQIEDLRPSLPLTSALWNNLLCRIRRQPAQRVLVKIIGD
jgi:hypothetical protein